MRQHWKLKGTIVLLDPSDLPKLYQFFVCVCADATSDPFSPGEKASVSPQTGNDSEKNATLRISLVRQATFCAAALKRTANGGGGAAGRSITRRSWDVISRAATQRKHARTQGNTRGFSVLRFLHTGADKMAADGLGPVFLFSLKKKPYVQ